MVIEFPKLQDLDDVLRVAKNSQVFSTDELDVVKEMFDGFFHPNSYNDHTFIVCRKEAASTVVGFSIYGPVPMADRIWDLYWICTDRGEQGRGVGGALWDWMEKDVRSHGARAMYLETSDSDLYAPARRFYERHGWERAAHLPDYYKVGEGMLIYRKTF